VGALLHAAGAPELKGPVNVVAPAPATNRVFSRALARVLQRPQFLRIPAFLLRLLLGELSSVLLYSQRVVPTVLTASDYRFRYPELVSALHAVLGGEPGSVTPPFRSGQV
jgi:NAD dependent epimerase/dehydratase family enzyme